MEAGLWEADGNEPYQAEVAEPGDDGLVWQVLKGLSFGGSWARTQRVHIERAWVWPPLHPTFSHKLEI